ncbi:MAG: hypothetical protein CM15mP9_3010 [Methanobacteriota archaeon]|nr:MAG: hypothetical protein CM15mP9_3010 [Euryarchaeota archaeon]
MANAQRLEGINDIFAAVGCMSMSTDRTYDTYSPIPVMEVHGFGGVVLMNQPLTFWKKNMGKIQRLTKPGRIENIFEWSELNNCTGNIETFDKNPSQKFKDFQIVRMMLRLGDDDLCSSA